MIIAIGVIALLTGCATIVRGTEQEVAVNTAPVGATVQFSNGQTCTSPCKIKSARNQSLMINISKPGCHTQTATMMPTLAGGGVLLGGLIDYGTGAVYDLQPNPLTVTLACNGDPSGIYVAPAGGTINCVSADGARIIQVVGGECPAPFKPMG
ncbi:hypothetical protein [Reyranella sp.]|uniref:hypothetical protein n=1 Tax=Reyranella sp. TaxID=1929291 RepID=UPI003BAD080F